MEKWIYAVIGTDIFVVVLVLVAAPQNTIAATIGSSILVLVCMSTILLYGIPALTSKTKFHDEVVFSIVLVIPYLSILVTGGSGLNQIHLFIVWYLFPSSIMMISHRLSNRLLRAAFLLSGAAILWIGFDHRYTRSLFEGYSDSYLFNALWMASVALVSCKGKILSGNTFDRGILPTKEGAKIANIATLIASVIIVPFGLLTGFLEWNLNIDPFFIVIGFIGIFLTISLQEELVFRGIALRELDVLAKNSVNQQTFMKVNLLVTSLLFALTHWNNETIQYVWHYFFAAFVAGIAYAVSYRKGGMFGAMLSHTLVDWFWALFLKRVD